MMKKSGYRGSSERDSIMMSRQKQLADDEMRRRMGGDSKTYPETAEKARTKES